ncbi:hypothetical protein C2G38_2287072, partial [Gigaspora rosea]
MIDLLYLTEGEESLNDRKNPNDIPEELRTHYVLITDFTRLMRKWNNHHGKKYFCRKCLRFPYSRLDLLQEHILTCPGPNKASQRLILPEEGKNYVKPKYIKNMLIKPYLISVDLESKEIEEEEKDKEGNTIKIAEQIAVSYGYTIHCSDGTTQKPVINRESENIIKDLMENLQEDLDVILDKLCDPLLCEKMTPKLWRQYQMAIGQLQFIDSLKFSLPGLAKMAENLRDEKKGQTKTPEQLAKCFPFMSKFISPHLLSLLTRKGIFLYQWLNSKTKFNETQLPSRKDFNSDLDGFNYCDHNCRIEKCEHGEKIGKCKHKCQKCKHKKEPEKSNRGCCLEIKLSIPKELHPKFRDYPMCPERKKVPYDWYSLKQKE